MVLSLFVKVSYARKLIGRVVITCCSVICFECNDNMSWQVMSRDLAHELRALADELSRSRDEDALEEQTAHLLDVPRRLHDLRAEACHALQRIPLPPLGRLPEPLGSLHPLPVEMPRSGAAEDRVRCTVTTLSGNVVAELFVLRGQPWLDAVPFGCWCHYWGVASFRLVEGETVVFPQPRLSQRVTAEGPLVLKLLTSSEPPPVHIRVVIGKAAGGCQDYTPPLGTSPLYEFCELQTLMLRDLDRVQLRELDLRSPEGPVAKQLLGRFREMLGRNGKLGKRTLNEFRAGSTSAYYLHVLVSSDGQRLGLRAKLLHDPVYLRVPFVEDGRTCPWNQQAFREVCDAIQHGSI